MATSTVPSTRTPAQLFAIVSAVVYLGAGLVGFAITGLEPFVGLTGESLLLLAINPLHNVVHLALGGLYLAASTDHERARQVNRVIGIGLLAAFVLGVVGGANVLNIDGVAEPDNWLHLTWGAASIAFARRALGTQ